jgi:hypothetical protein
LVLLGSVLDPVAAIAKSTQVLIATHVGLSLSVSYARSWYLLDLHVVP